MNITTLFKQTLFLITFLVLSWILIHFLAIFGVFLALAIPLLHLAFYPHILCFWCRLSSRPHQFRHSLIDSILIIVLTAISLPLVYLESRLISAYLGVTPQIAELAEFTIPTRSTYQIGEIVTLPLELTNIKGSINVVQADLTFDPKYLEVVELSTDHTFTAFLVQKEFDNTKGYVRLTGGLPNPGYSQKTGLIGTVYFRTKQSGATELRYLDSSLVLANNGRGTNLLSDYPRIPLIITPASAAPSPDTTLRIKNQVQGDKDKTVLTFTEYAHNLPQPFQDIEGASTPSTALNTTVDTTPPLQTPIARLLKLDHQIFTFWLSLFQ